MQARSKPDRWCGMITGLLSAVAAWGQTAPASAPATATALDPELDRILTQVEQRRVQDLHARLSWRQEYVVDEPGEAVTKCGEIWYQQAEPVARFLIHFNEWRRGGEKRKLDERHLFDGCWYVEVQSQTKTVQRREVRRPDDPGDPYKVGEGAFPLPFGQKKEDILREFEVALLSPADDDPPNTDHLRLTPRAGTRTGREYKELEFWVDRSGPTVGLPLKVRVAKLDGTGRLNSHITIVFSEPQLNRGLRPDTFEIKTPAGYTEMVEKLEPVAPPAGAREGSK